MWLELAFIVIIIILGAIGIGLVQNDPIDKGTNEYYDGLNITDNPYDPKTESDKHSEWKAGYLGAKDFDTSVNK